MLLIDACHSGEFDKETTAVASANVETGTVKARGFKRVTTAPSSVGLENSFNLVQSYLSDVRRSTGAMVIASASGQEFAFESDAWHNGVFTFAALDGAALL